VERNTSSLADVVEEMSKLHNVFSKDGRSHGILEKCLTSAEVKKAESIFEKRNAETKIQTVYYLANLLHPKYRGETFADDEVRMRKTLNYLNVYSEDIGVVKSDLDREELGRQLSRFRMREDIFETKLLSHSDASMFWENHMQFTSCRMLAIIGARILSIPASSASVERSFSEQGHLHSKSRNRFTDQNVDKLMRIKWNLKQEEREKSSKTKMHDQFEGPDILEVGNRSINGDNLEEDMDIDEIIQLDESYTEDELLQP
jgi:hypothetical protein